MDKIFFDSWESIGRTLLIGLLAYVGLILQLRIAGKRTLSQMNAFDFIVTVALGSTLATVLLNKSVALADGLVAFALLIFLQLVITWLSVRSPKVDRLVKATPTLLVYKGKFLSKAMKAERVTEEEVLATLRQQGIGSILEVDAVVLETQGKLSVVANVPDKKPENTVLQGVRKSAL